MYRRSKEDAKGRDNENVKRCGSNELGRRQSLHHSLNDDDETVTGKKGGHDAGELAGAQDRLIAGTNQEATRQ